MVDQETPGGNNLQQTLTSPNKCPPGTRGWPRNTWWQQLATHTYITKQVPSWNPWLTKKHLVATTCNTHLHHQTSALLEPMVDQETPGGNNLQQTLTSPNKCPPGTRGWPRNTWRQQLATDTYITKQVLSWNPWLTKKHLAATTCNRHLHHQTSALLEPMVDQETPGGNNLQHTLTSPNKCPPGTRGWPRNTWRQQLATHTSRVGYTWKQLQKIAQDRDAGKLLLAAYTPGGVTDISNKYWTYWDVKGASDAWDIYRGWMWSNPKWLAVRRSCWRSATIGVPVSALRTCKRDMKLADVNINTWEHSQWPENLVHHGAGWHLEGRGDEVQWYVWRESQVEGEKNINPRAFRLSLWPVWTRLPFQDWKICSLQKMYIVTMTRRMNADSYLSEINTILYMSLNIWLLGYFATVWFNSIFHVCSINVSIMTSIFQVFKLTLKGSFWEFKTHCNVCNFY